VLLPLPKEAKMTDKPKTAAKRTRKMARPCQVEASGPRSQVKTIENESPAPPLAVARPRTKTSQVLTLLKRSDGATLAELVCATGWLPHTARAALTGLRKRGHAITRNKRGDMTCYLLVGDPQ
jgi:hypothetical protein